MSSIVTITFSPCIDKSSAVEKLVPHKKLQCKSPTLEPGGGGINVARAIKKLGGSATAIFPSGGYTGKFFNHLLEKEGIPSVIIECANETRENIVVLEELTNNQYRFGMPATSLTEDEWRQCLAEVEKIKDLDFIIGSGSLPPGVPADIYLQLAGIARKKNAKFIIDTSGEALKLAIKEGAYLIKPNISELSALAGKMELNHAEIKGFAKKMIAEGKCVVIIISMGAKGALLVTKDINEMIPAPKTKMKSTVGAGDCMVAGIVYYLSKGKHILEAAQYGVACGTAATMNPGTELCKKEDADNLFTSIRTDCPL